MIRRRHARIVATLGPATRTPERVLALAHMGVDVFRLNFSHGLHEDHADAFAAVRDAEQAVDRPLGVLADLQGPSCASARSIVASFQSNPEAGSGSISIPHRVTKLAFACRTRSCSPR